MLKTAALNIGDQQPSHPVTSAKTGRIRRTCQHTCDEIRTCRVPLVNAATRQPHSSPTAHKPRKHMHQKKADTSNSCTEFKQTVKQQPSKALAQQQKKLPKLLFCKSLRHNKHTQKTGKAHSLQLAASDRLSGTLPVLLLLCNPETCHRNGLKWNLLWKLAIGDSRTAAPAHFLIREPGERPGTGSGKVPQSEES